MFGIRNHLDPEQGEMTCGYFWQAQCFVDSSIDGFNKFGAQNPNAL